MSSKSGKVSISDRQVTQTEQIELPSFQSVPKGLDIDSGAGNEPDDGGGEGEEDDNGSGPGGILPPPSNIRVKSQTVKYTPEGRQLVDVVLEWDEVEGAVGYDVRVTKP